MCEGTNHPLEEVIRFGTEDTPQSVVRWCPECEAVVGDGEWDGRVRPGALFPMRFPTPSNSSVLLAETLTALRVYQIAVTAGEANTATLLSNGADPEPARLMQVMFEARAKLFSLSGLPAPENRIDGYF